MKGAPSRIFIPLEDCDRGGDDRTGNEIESLYSTIKAPLIRTSIEVAEMIKYSDNVWHALKVAFANEIGIICKGVHVDSHEVMDIFCQDLKLNLSGYYLKPGFSFGGSCLPKDVRALVHKARSLDLDLPLLESIFPRTKADDSRLRDDSPARKAPGQHPGHEF